MDVDLSVTGYEESVSLLSNFNSTMDTRILSFLERVAETCVFHAKNNIQNNQSIITGALLASIRILAKDPGGKWIDVGSDEFYSVMVEYGRGPIRPINVKYLRWVDKYTGKVVFAKYAGPANPKPFLEPAVIQVEHESPGIWAVTEDHNLRTML